MYYCIWTNNKQQRIRSVFASYSLLAKFLDSAEGKNGIIHSVVIRGKQ